MSVSFFATDGAFVEDATKKEVGVSISEPGDKGDLPQSGK
jgi:hypothetical protein